MDLSYFFKIRPVVRANSLYIWTWADHKGRLTYSSGHKGQLPYTSDHKGQLTYTSDHKGRLPYTFGSGCWPLGPKCLVAGRWDQSV